MSRIDGLLIFKVVKVFVAVVFEPVPYAVVCLAVPSPGHIVDESLDIPVRDLDLVSACSPVAQVSVVEHFVYHHFGDSRGDQFAKLLVVTVEPEHNLVLDNPAVAADIIVILGGYKAYVALSEVVLLVVDDEYGALVDSVVEIILNLIQFLVGHLACVFRHFPAELIVIAVNLVKPEVCPVEVLVLNPVLAEGHLHAVIELA